MFVVKTIHRGNNFKKLLRAKITKDIPQLVSISENHIEVFDYEIDENLNIPYLLLNVDQLFIFHILDAEILNTNIDRDSLVLLTTCGLLILEYNNHLNIFISIAAVSFSPCEPRDTFMYLKVVDRYIITYSLTNQLNIFLYNNDLYALKFSPVFTENIIEVLQRFQKGLIIIEIILTDNKSLAFMTKPNQNTLDKCYDEGLLFYNNNVREHIKAINIIPYKFLISPLKNLLFIFSEMCYIIMDPLQKSPLKTIKFDSSNILISSICFESYIQLVFDKVITFYSENDKQINIKEKYSLLDIKNEGNHQNKLFNKSIIRIDKNYFIFYDNMMNIFFTKYELNSKTNTLYVNLLNEFQNSTFFCLDSKIIKNKLDENQIYALCGIKGKSRIIRYVKGMEEVKIKTFNYLPKIRGIFDLRINRSIHILVINLYSSCHILSFYSNNNQIELNEKILNQEYYLENQCVLDATFLCNKYITLCSRNNISIFEVKYSINGIEELILKRTKEFDNILYIKTFEYLNRIIYIIITNSIRIYAFEDDEFIHLGENNYFKNISTFDFFLRNHILHIIIGTYDNYIELITYDLTIKKFEENAVCSIKLQTEFLINHIKIIESVIFITIRNGNFGIFSYNDGGLYLIKLVNICEDPSLSIDFIKKTSEGFFITLFSEEDCFNLSINNNLDRILKFKLVISENFKKFNCLKTIEYDDNLFLYLYQNSESSKLQFSYFFKYNNNNQIGETLRLFNYNQIAKKLINFNNTHLYILLEKHENDVVKNSIYIYCIESKTEALILLDDEITKVNSIRIIDFIYEDESLSGCRKYFLFICAEINKGQKGCLYTYKIENDNLIKSNYSNKCLCEKPLIDCKRINYHNNKNNSILAMIMENKLCTIQIDYDQIKLKITPLFQQSLLNKLISLSTFPHTDHVIIGDSTESFNVQIYDSQKQKFEIVGSDIAIRYLYKTISDEDYKNIGLVQKNGVYSHFYLNEDIYEIKGSVDLKELLTEVSVIRDIDKLVFQKLYLSTGLLGSIIFIGEINISSLLHDFSIGINEILDFQAKLIKAYSKLFFKKEINIDQLMHNFEPNLNFVILDLIEILRKDNMSGNFFEIENLANFEKIMSFFGKIEEIFENLK